MKGLEGLTIAITGSRRASELAHIISSLGGIPYIAPTVGIRLQGAETHHLIRNVIDGEVDYVIFMTGPGTYTVVEMAERLGLRQDFVRALNHATVVARSDKPKRALAEHGVKVDVMPTNTHDQTSEGVAKEMRKFDLTGKRVGIVWHGTRDGTLEQALREAGASVSERQVYEYGRILSEDGARILGKMGFQFAPPEEERVVELTGDVIAGKIDAVTFTSPPAARNLFDVARPRGLEKDLVDAMNSISVVVAVGLPTRKAIEENGVGVDAMPEVYKMGPMIQALVEYVKANPNLKAISRRKTVDRWGPASHLTAHV